MMFPAPDYDMDVDTTEPQRRLPRSFVDDPFFSNSDVFRDFHRDLRDFPSRRFGSNPRLFDEEANKFFSEFEPRASFHSLSRRGERTSSRSPGPQGHHQQGQQAGSQTERPIPVRREYTTQQERSPSRQAGSQTIPVRVERSDGSPQKNSLNQYFAQQYQQQEEQRHAHQNLGQRSSPPQNVNIVNIQPTGEIREINNTQNTSSYTNGQLNPDRRAQNLAQAHAQAPPAKEASSQNQPIPTITVNSPVDSPPEKKFIVKEDSRDSDKQESMQSGASKTENREIQEVKQENGEGNDQMPPTRRLGRGFSIEGCSDQLLDLLDDAEIRVEKLRETAAQLEQEKEQLLDILNNVKLNTELMRMSQGDKDDLLINADRILSRCKAVDVVVSTPRNEHQAKALEEVNNLLQAVINKMQEDLSNSKETVKRYLNACCPDQPDGPIDQKFQAKVIECTADDQKKIRRKLAQIIAQIERAEKVVPSE